MWKNVKLGIAPIGWTNDDMPKLGGNLTYEQMLSEAALAGFSGTEIGGKFPTDATVLKKPCLFVSCRLPASGFRHFCALNLTKRMKLHS